MHLVFLNQYYPPDAAPTGVMLEAVVEELAAQGHEVTVLCAEGGYAGGRHEIQQNELSVAGRRLSEEKHVAAVCDRRGEGEDDEVSPDLGCDAHGAPRQVAPQVIRIGATRFGRETLWGKLTDYLSYYIGVAWRLARMVPRPDRVVALTTPPYLSVLARALSKLRGADHAHWVMDVYPDVMVAHGMLRHDSSRHRFLAALARWGWGGARCAAVVTLGPDMAERIGHLRTGRRSLETGGSPGTGPVCAPDVVWVPLWGGDEAVTEATEEEEEAAARALRRQRGWRDGDLVVMYSGNMGLGHRFGEILEVIGGGPLPQASSNVPDGSENGPCQPRFVFFGGGKRRGEVAEFAAAHPECLVELHDYVPREQLSAHLQSADLHLVSLDPSWTGTMLPSKLQGIFAAARPVVFVGDERSSLARWMIESGGGWVVKPGDVDGLRAAIAEASSPKVRTVRGRAAQRFAMKHFDRRANARQVAACLGFDTKV